MAELIDKAQLAPRTEVELFEGGKLLLTASEDDPFLPTFIALDAKAATLLFDFLLLHQDRLIRHRDAQPSTAYQQAKPAIDAYVKSNPFVEDESHGEATQDWHRRAIVRFKEDVTCHSFAGEYTYTKGQEIEMLQWGRAGRPVDRAWWSDFDIDLAFIVEAAQVEVIKVIEETPPT